MNYLKINKAVMNNEHLNSESYDYLLKNNVLYFCAKRIGDRKILEVGDELNSKYYETLKIVKETCEREEVDFALFKTHRHIPEVFDGDIDLVVRKKDFKRFMELFADGGFSCIEEAPFKGVCEKPGLLKLEPRSVVSYHGFKVFDEEEIWRNVVSVDTPIGVIKTTSIEFDVASLLLNVLYGPKYVTLYLLVLISVANPEKIRSIYTGDDLWKLLNEFRSPEILERKFPIFLDNMEYIDWFLRYLFLNKSVSAINKFRHFVFFFFSKFEYIILGRPHFLHKWL